MGIFDFLFGLKECPQCMSDKGFSIHTTTTEMLKYDWDESLTGSEVIKVERGAIHCSCCGVIIKEELREIKNLTYGG